MDQITGQVARIIYRNAENGWTVIELKDDSGDEITAVGTLPLCSPGERVELTGGFVEHRQYGRQFKALSCVSIAPATLGALESYLSSGLIKGVGEVTARNIVELFGLDTLHVLEHEPQRLAEVPGIGKSRAKLIAESFLAQRAFRETVMALQGYGITVRQAVQLQQLYGAACLQVVQENPYRLIEEAEGIGFKTADKIAQNMGIEPTSRARLRAGVLYMLLWARQEGHTYLPKEALLHGAADILEVTGEFVEEALYTLILDNSVHSTLMGDAEAVYLPNLYRMEADSARRLLSLAAIPEDAATLDLARELDALERKFDVQLAGQQRDAIFHALSEGAMVITGGPGTGKTTILQFVLHILTRLGLDFALCAPTGRAAKRMTEATGFEASTIHRLLEYGGEGQPRFARNTDNPLLVDMIVVDEMSMVDLPLFYALLLALPAGTRLVMVGDADQLPPVGAGTVLHDIIKSDIIRVARLTEIFRQASRSGIVKNAHRINAGEHPAPGAEDDFQFIPCNTPDETFACVRSICTGENSPAALSDPLKDIQVLSPTRKGPLGVKALNAKLQQALNPPAKHKAEREYGDTLFREGDKVMQIKNDYRLEWQRNSRGRAPELGTGMYNGDLGTVYRIKFDEQEMDVLFDDERMASYAFAQLDELELAYCISIHKSQGSEFPMVVLPLFNGPPMLMTRNLLYTAITRARTQVIMLGDWRSVVQMVDNRHTRPRYSGLCIRLQELQPLLLKQGEQP